MMSLTNPHLGAHGRIPRVIAASVLLAAAVSGQQIDAGFGKRAHGHVEALAALGPRLPGTPADGKAEAYIAGQMRSAGLSVSIEKFEFDSFNMERADVVTAAGLTEAVRNVIFDPYAGPLEISGAPLFLAPSDLQRTDAFLESTKGRILIAGPAMKPFHLTFRGPKAAVIVSQEGFERLKSLAPREVTIRVRGAVAHVKTSNVVGTAGNGTGPYLMFTAHRDSVDTAPGADDNASGVAVILELARAWQAGGVTRPARFVALAAEESGLIGAQAYVSGHTDDLKRCALVFNIDTVGAAEGFFLDANGGMEGVEPGWKPIVRAELGPDGTWIAPAPFEPASNVPAWLREAIVASAAQTGIKVDLGQFSGSDHLVFARAGVPSTHIVSPTGKAHTKNDTAANVSEEALARAGRFAVAVAGKVK